MEKHLTVGIAGHVDHGKTRLVRVLTGIDTDRLEEEKRRRVSIDAGVALYQEGSEMRLALVDVPGHTDYLKNTIRGLSGVDLGILVVAADDGVMPQTLEHIDILSFMGAKRGFVVLSKIDLVDTETAEMAVLEVMEATKDTFLDDSPVIPFSAETQRGLNQVRAALSHLWQTEPARATGGPLRLWIDQVRTLSGFGTVVSGTLASGSLQVDTPLQLLPGGPETRARSLQVHHQPVTMATAGQRVGIALSKVPFERVRRGMVLVAPEGMGTTCLVNTDLRARAQADQPLHNHQRVKLCVGTSVVNALAVIMDKEQLLPGERGLVQLRFSQPLPLLSGDRFIICSMNLPIVLGGGTILEIPTEKYRAGKAACILPCLEALREKDLDLYLDAFFQRAGLKPEGPDGLARSSCFDRESLRKAFETRLAAGRLKRLQDGRFVNREIYRSLKGELVPVAAAILQRDPLKRFLSPEELRNACGVPIHELPFQQMLLELCHEGKFVRQGSGYTIPDFRPALPKEKARLIDLLLAYAEGCQLVPFSADTFWKAYDRQMNKNEIQRILDYLHASGKLIRLSNRRYLSPGAVDEIKRRVRQRIEEKGRIDLSDSKDLLGYGRTVGIPVLEYLDTVGFTVRQGNERLLNGAFN